MLGVKTMAHFIFECLFCVSFLLLWKDECRVQDSTAAGPFLCAVLSSSPLRGL